VRKMPRKPAIPVEVRQETENILKKHVQHCLKKYEIRLLWKFQGKYLYIDCLEQDISGWRKKKTKLCRLECTGDMNRWILEIFKYSDMWYDTDREFPYFYSGKIEDCINAVADFYILEKY